MFVLVSNPGSNSRKYSLFFQDREILSFFFDPNGGIPDCDVTDTTGKEKMFSGKYCEMENSGQALKQIMNEIDPSLSVGMILIRIVATGDYFAEDHIVDDECIRMLERDSARTPLHAPITLHEINTLKNAFPDVKIALISDSKFHASRPDVSKYYGFSLEFADAHQIKRYGAHGLSNESVVQQLKRIGMLPDKLVVCHIGSGVSVTAIKNGRSVETTMGYTPLEGVLMATRCGDIDPSAVFALKRAKGFSDEETEKWLNQECGLLGIAGSNDFRDIDVGRFSDVYSAFAYEKFVYRIQQEVGKMSASMGGVDALVLTATISERNYKFRKDLVFGLGFLGFCIEDGKNESYHYSHGVANIAGPGSKAVFVIRTNETEVMLEHAKMLL